jgi:hypothetical protein
MDINTAAAAGQLAGGINLRRAERPQGRWPPRQELFAEASSRRRGDLRS